MHQKLTVRQVADLTGVSVRTLHYYDEIGLLHPSAVGENGYRQYDEEDVRLLQQILFFRELDFPLKEIRAIIQNPSFDKTQALRRHRELLLLKRRRLGRLIALVDDTLKGDDSMSFDAFTTEELQKARGEYAAEARERYGATDAYKQSEQKTRAYKKEDWESLSGEMNDLFRRLASVMDKDPGDPLVQALVKEWQALITARFYDCSDEILGSLGEMYVEDERFTKNIDRFSPGLSRFLRDAIRIYTKS